MLDIFTREIESIQNILNNDSTQIVRFLFSDEVGQLRSITTLSSKIKSLDLKKSIDFQKICNILQIQNDKNLILLPDSTTCFSDPCTVQNTCCILCSVFEADEAYDDRSYLSHIEADKQFDVIFSFTLNDANDVLEAKNDVFYDLRSEIILEGHKAGVDMNSHYATENNICTLSFSSKGALLLADSIQKLKMIVNSIAASYGKTVNFSSGNKSFILVINDVMTFSDKLKNRAKEIHSHFNENDKSLKLFFDTIDVNPYSLMKNLFL